MNKLVIAAVSGVLLSLAIAFVVVYLTTYYYVIPSSSIKFHEMEEKTTIKNSSFAPAYVLALSNTSYVRSETALIASLPTNITENLTYSPFNSTPQIIYNKSIEYNVFYVQPSFIHTKPNSTISFILYFNMTYLKMYNDSIYTDQIGNIVRVINVTPLNSSNTTFTEYKVDLYIGNVKQNTLIFLPIWDTKSLEIQYVLILVY